MGRNAERKKLGAAMECACNIFYENIARVLDIDPKSNYRKRKLASLQKFERVYSRLSPKKKETYFLECVEIIKVTSINNFFEFNKQYEDPNITTEERNKIKFLLLSWKSLESYSVDEIARFLDREYTPELNEEESETREFYDLYIK